jgi:hypothetical protein
MRAPDLIPLPDTVSACRERLVALQGEIASIKTQIATADIARQARRGALDAQSFHRARTALSFKQQEAARVSAQLAALAGGLARDRFKDTLIDVLREQLPDDAWQSALAVARARQARRCAMAELPIVVSPTREAIFAAYEADARTGFRAHLGASLIGKSCERALWYDFRWTTTVFHPGRVLRLFETGQLEEARIVRNLRRIGATVLEVDPETGRQWRVEAHGGHFGGSLDAVALNLPEAPKTWHVVEFKTHASKSFVELVAKGCAKPSRSTSRRCRSTCGSRP